VTDADLRGVLLANSAPACVYCRGAGIQPGPKPKPCGCALRAVFRDVMARYEECDALGAPITTSFETEYGREAVMRFKAGRSGRQRRPEFRADVEAAARSALTPEQLAAFRAYHLGRQPWHKCLKLLPFSVGKGRLFHLVYRIEARLGRAFLERGLFPTDRY
jgi:hypothetical protein